MKVYIGPYFGHTRNVLTRNIEKVIGEMSYTHPVYKFFHLKPVEKFLHFFDLLLFRAGDDQKIDVRIDYYDTWNLDHTLAQIIYPALVQLKNAKHGCFVVDNEDLPEELRSAEGNNVFDTEFHLMEKQTDWLFDEMIFAFKAKAAVDDDMEPRHPLEKYKITRDNPMMMFEKDFKSPWSEEELQKYYAERDAYEARVHRGLRFFGEYYSHLWD